MATEPVGPEEWTPDNVLLLGISFAPLVDNTSDFTRNTIKSKIPRRYFDMKMTFTWDGKESEYLRVNGACAPYVPPPTSRKTGGRVPAIKYGTEYVYAGVPRCLLDRIKECAEMTGAKAVPGGKLVSTDEDWWMTLSFTTNTTVKVYQNGVAKNVSLARIFAATNKGVMCNVFLSMKLKCSVQEEKREDGNYYEWNENSTAVPNPSTEWQIAPTLVSAVVTDINMEMEPPAKSEDGKYRAQEAPVFAPSEADIANDELSSALSQLGI